MTAANTQRLTRAAVTASNPAPSQERSLSPDGSLFVSLSVSESPVAPQSGLDTSHSPHSENLGHGTEGHYLEEDEVRELMIKAYGRELMTTADTPETCPWVGRWEVITQHQARHYSLPGGSVGRKYVDTLTNEVLQLASGNYPSERLIVFSSLMLQRDRNVKKASDIRQLLERRLALWYDEKFDVLLQEACKALRNRVRWPKDDSHVDRVFSRLMMQGKIRAAVRWITERSSNGLLAPTDETIVTVGDGSTTSMSVLDVLKSKHPNPRPPHTFSLLDADELPHLEDIEITGAIIHKVVFGIQGGAGPGGADAGHWHDVLLRYGSHSSRLRDAVASLSRTMANDFVLWKSFKALLANRLIALNKNPGVRPIGIGETLRRIIGKAICYVTRDDVEMVCGSDQLCAGVKMGIEAAFHAVHDLFERNTNSDWGLLTIDASNAFNSLNRVALLWNARILWPTAARFIFNTYQGWSTLVLRGSTENLASMEGVTQGDPISMFLYAVGSVPLIRRLKDVTRYIQLWYADDSCAGGSLSSVREWYDKLIFLGPLFGYFPEPSKCHLIVSESNVDRAKSLFCDIAVNVVTGWKFLGGSIGCKEVRDSFVSEKVAKWSDHVHRLSSMCVSQPQSAYVALTKSLQSEWIFLQRIMSDCAEQALSHSFLPSLFGCLISQTERSFFTLPVKMGGLNIKDPTITPSVSYVASRNATAYLVDALKDNIEFESEAHNNCVYLSRQASYKEACDQANQLFNVIVNEASDLHKRTLQKARDCLSAWLLVPPIEKENFDLSAEEFRDGLALRYGKPLLQLPPVCDGCGSDFSVTHALDCRKGGLVTQRHNEIRDTICGLASMVWGQVTQEPVVCDSLDSGNSSLVADIAIRGVWQRQATALFDVRVIDTDARSYLHRPPQSIIATAEREKKRKYSMACAAKHVSFTPLCFSVDGLMGAEAKSFLDRLGDFLATKWERPYSIVIHWLRVKLSMALLRATNLCLRGTRCKFRPMNIDDGASLHPSLSYYS